MKISLNKLVKNNIFIKKNDSFVGFFIPHLFTNIKHRGVYCIVYENWDAKLNKMIDFL